MDAKQTSKEIENKAFTYYVKDYDIKKKIYTLENPVTKDVKRIPKEDFDKMRDEQNNASGFHFPETQKKQKKR